MLKLKKSLLFAALPMCLLIPNAFAGTYVLDDTPLPPAAVAIGPLLAGVQAPLEIPTLDLKEGVPASHETEYIWEWVPDYVGDTAPAKYVEHSFQIANGPITASWFGPADAGAEVNFGARINFDGSNTSRHYDVFAGWTYFSAPTVQTNFPVAIQTHQSLTMINPVGGKITTRVTVETGTSYALAIALGTGGTASATAQGNITTTGVALIP